LARARTLLPPNQITVTLAAIAIALLVLSSGYRWPPSPRRTSDLGLLDQFKKATPLEPTDRGNGIAEWDVECRISDGNLATVRGSSHWDVISVTYADERQKHDLYDYRDYGGPIAVRRLGDVLYVYWGQTLFTTEYWLLAYDLRARNEIDRRRIDPTDLPPTEAKGVPF
jgi:hypothetical protein